MWLWRAFIATTVFLLASPLAAHAHPSLSILTGKVADAALEVVVQLPDRWQLDDIDAYTAYVAQAIQVQSGESDCPLSDITFTPGSFPYTHFRAICPRPIYELDLHIEEFLGYPTIASISKGAETERVLFDGETYDQRFEFDGESAEYSSARTIQSFVTLGATHVFSGVDHLLFLLALLFTVQGVRATLILVTTFTLAHSITLALGSLDLVALSPAIVEPLIALSIAIVAFEKEIKALLRRWLPAERLPVRFALVPIVFGFGLMHGLGFAGVIREIGFPAGTFALSLVSFNVGIELAQLAVAALIVPLLWYSARFGWHLMGKRVALTIIGSIGIGWFLERVIFGV